VGLTLDWQTEAPSRAGGVIVEELDPEDAD
jgi:hypothetical protein